MNILTLTYIFILYILFISCLLYKQSGTYKITYALLFTIILYLTIDVVNQTMIPTRKNEFVFREHDG